MLVSRRALFATVLVTALVMLVVVAAATAKRAVMNMVVHAYDLFFYFSSWSTVSYLWSDQRRYMLAAAVAVLRRRFCRLARLPPRQHPRVALAGRRWRWWRLRLLAWYGAQTKGERRHMQFYYANLYVSSFYASWGETLETLWRGALLEAAPAAAAAVRLHHPDALPRSRRSRRTSS